MDFLLPSFSSDPLSRRSVLIRLLCPPVIGIAAGTGGLSAHAQTATSATGASTAKPRLISLGGGLTEVVYALGAERWLVGTDTTSVYPAAAQNTAKVGYLRSLSAEGLLALRPTALVASSEAGPPVVLDQLRAAGVHIELVQADHTWAEVQRKVIAVGRATQQEASAQQYGRTLESQWQTVMTRIRPATGPQAPKVLFILSHSGSPMVSGEGTAADAIIRLIGARNALTGFKGYRPMTAEAMAAAAPDTILTTTQGLEAMGGSAQFWSRPELQLTPAWRQRTSERALVHRDALELLGFTPRMPSLVEQLHRQLVQT